MVFFNYALRKLNAKIVYYGPGLCGKTTNLVWIHDHFEGGERGKMISLATEGDRTIFFDLLPLEIGSIRGMDVTLQLYTVPGQVHYNSTRQLVLRGADGVVFVADSQRAMQSSNIDSFKNLQENLLLQGISLDGFPHALQFNKRDLKNLVTIEELNDDLNHYSVPIFEAVATEGVGVQETLEGIVKLVMRNLRQRYEGATAGARTPGVEDPQIQVPDIPPAPPPGPTEVVSPEPPEPISFADGPTSVDELSLPPEELPEPSIEELDVPAEPPPEEEPASPEELLGPAIAEPLMPDDPAKTIDFSRSAGADPFGGLGGGFEDEVSTSVYDLNDDSAIDFDELKKLDAPAEVPEPPLAEDPTILAEPSSEEETPVGEDIPQVDLPEVEIVDTVAGATLPEVPEEAPAEFDFESTDAGMKTQELSQVSDEDPMGAFDFDAPPPDEADVPDFELEEVDSLPDLDPLSEAEPMSEFEPEPRDFAIAPEAPEIEPEIPEIEVETIPPLAEAEIPEIPEEPAAVDVLQAPPPQRPAAEGPYVDRIEAPSPFAPDAETPREAPEVFEALRATAEAEVEETIPEAPAIEPVMELPPDEPAEELTGEEPIAEIVPGEEELVAEAAGDESDTDLDGEVWEEPFAEEAVAEAAAEEPFDDFAVEEPVEGPSEQPEVEPQVEPTAEEPVAELAAEDTGEPTADQLLAQVMESGAVPAVEEVPPEEPTDLEAVEEIAVEEPETELVTGPWGEPTEEDVETETAVEEPEADSAAEAWEEPTEDEAVAETVVEEPETEFAAESWEEPTEEEAVADEPFEEVTAAESDEEPEISDQEEEEEPPIEEEPEAFESTPSDEAEEEEPAAAADALEEGPFEAKPQEPVVVGSDDPWTEEELSDVYRVSEVEKAEQVAAIEAATPRAVDVQAEDNQLHLRLQGTGAIVEAGQVRALDIEVPVPGAWVGNKRVTLQLRLTLVPDMEDEDDGSGSPS
jgi:signal recognition particle receptor subunit beta